MKTSHEAKRALVISVPTPHYLGTLTISTAKIINSMLEEGWEIDIIGFKEKGNYAQPDKTLSSLIKGARVFESESFLGKPSTWVRPALNKGRELMGKYPYDLILSITPYTWTPVVAYFFKKRFGIPWIIYFGDPWGNNPDLKMRFIRRFMERQALSFCDAVIYSSSKLKDWALSQFPRERFEIEEKSYVIPYFYDNKLNHFPKKHKDQNKMVIRHMGQVPYGGYILNLLHGLKMLIDEDISIKNKIVFECYGRINPTYKGSVERLVKDLGLEDLIVFYKDGDKVIHIPYAESLKFMEEADALLLLGVHPSYFYGLGNTVLHVKIVDYFGVDKPIFALAGKGSITHELLKDTNGICTDDDPVSIKNALCEFIKNPQLSPPEIRKRFSKERVYPLWQEVFNKVLVNT